MFGFSRTFYFMKFGVLRVWSCFLFSLGHFTLFLWLQQSRGRKIYDVENMSLKVRLDEKWDLMRSVRSQTCTCFFKAEISSWQTPYEGYVLNILAKILKCSCTCHYSWLWEGYLLRRKSRYAFRCPSNPHVKLFRTSSPSLRVFILSAPTFYSTSVDFQVCNQRRNHTAAFASTWH